MIYIIRTTVGREEIVADMIHSRAKEEKAIKAIFHPAEIKGYIFIEGEHSAIQRVATGVMHVKGIIPKPVELDSIRHFLEQKKEGISLSIGDTVEIIGGPFKGEKGRVQRIEKDEVTVELLEAAIPIPVTIATEFVRLIKPAEKKNG
ncbi:MAG: transcription elongation factor Spt5 [Candidatus Aenigmatarchaeota archaeon]